MIPPYSLKLSDYQTTSSEKLFVNLLLTDTQDAGRQVRLKMYIEGKGLNIQTLDFVAGATPIFLDGGINQRLSNLDLRPYFSLNNLLGILPQQYNRPLPSGRYNFCFEVYDQLSGQRLSGKSCFPVYLILNDPPVLNIPSRNELVTAQNPQNVLFNWTPRHLNATGVQYEFTLKELWDTGLDPQAAFLSSPVFHQETTYAPTLLYGPANRPLLEGKTYAWQVRALVSDGISETSVFKNNGHSEIYHFTYQGYCDPPKLIAAKALNTQVVEITWHSSPHVRYKIQYRKKGYTEEADWFSVHAYNPKQGIHNLAAGTTYEFRIGGECTQGGGFAYGTPSEFTTLTEEEARYEHCGEPPEEITITNREPLQNIGVNETFTGGGGFPITVKEVTNHGNGVFSGWGFTTFPFFGDMKVKVAFKEIHINTDYQLIQGVVETTYDPDHKGVEVVHNAIDKTKQFLDKVIDALYKKRNEGTLSEEEFQEIRDKLSKQGGKLKREREALREANRALIKAQRKEDKESVAKIEEEIAEKAATVEQINKDLKKFQEEYGVTAKSKGGLDVKEDAFFDGVIAYGATKNTVVHKRFDGKGEIPLKKVSNSNKLPPDMSDYVFSHKGKNYKIIITHSSSSDEALNEAKIQALIPDKGIVIYLHYDLEKESLGYTVNFAKKYFDKLEDEDFLAFQQLHKEALLNKLKQERDVEDIANVIYNHVLELNTLFQEVLNSIQLPESIWNPDAKNYTDKGFHLQPLEAGLVDGAIEEIKSIPLIISLVVDYFTNPTTKEKIDGYFKDFDFTRELNKWYESEKHHYATGTVHQNKHRTGKHIVGVASLLTGAGAAIKGIKKGTEFVEGLASTVKKGVKRVGRYADIDEFWARITNNVDEVKDAFTTSTLRYAKEDMYLFRYCSKDAPQLSNWFTDEILGAQQARIKLALPMSNTAERVVKVKIPKGTAYVEGGVASQVGKPGFGSYATGNGKQFYFLDEDKTLLHVIEDIPNSN